MQRSFIVVICYFFLIESCFASSYYHWVDQEGVAHFSSQPQTIEFSELPMRHVALKEKAAINNTIIAAQHPPPISDTEELLYCKNSWKKEIEIRYESESKECQLQYAESQEIHKQCLQELMIKRGERQREIKKFRENHC